MTLLEIETKLPQGTFSSNRLPKAALTAGNWGTAATVTIMAYK